jgi:hypothetical protein
MKRNGNRNERYGIWQGLQARGRLGSQPFGSKSYFIESFSIPHLRRLLGIGAFPDEIGKKRLQRLGLTVNVQPAA